MASSLKRLSDESNSSEWNGDSGGEDITLLWGANVIASVVGTVLAAAASMIIGFNCNLLIGVGMYLGALGCAVAAQKVTQNLGRRALAK
jgi:hypothetical protein